MSTITFQCYACNQVLKVGADKAGRKAKCIGCGTILTIPMSSPEAEAVTPAAAPIPTPAAPPRRRDDDEDDDRDRDRGKRRRDDDDDDRGRGRSRRDDDDDDRPRRRRDEDDDDDRDRGRRRRDEEEDRDRGRRDRDDPDDDDDRGRRRRDEDDDRDRDRKGKSGKADWPKVSLGCTLAFYGLLAFAVGYGLIQLGGVIIGIMNIAGGGSIGLLRTMGIFIMIGVIVATLALICTVVGQVFWIFVTNKNGSLGLAISSLAVTAIYAILYIVFRMVPVFNYGGGLMFLGGLGGGLAVHILMELLVGAFFMLIFFYLRSLGQTLKDRYLTGKAMSGVIFAGVLAGYMLLTTLLAIIIGSSGGAGRGMFIVAFILNLIEIGLTAFVLSLAISSTGNAQRATDR